ncbi:c-type cytochrome domain-containing protein [Flagellimonas sediminis]|uniref:Cytochrome C Planctomycete-type domain-containing protein n=1 Tax=Flagellimonas sediminis TaxID=2696468 RepID=A0A6I5KZM6_9FLAO|nr:c-type cytochrome domain-containing protein [Allomuricauda sediminis]NDV43782.1 hypothetical protein [Allomuricauda sediminis]
MKDDTLYRLLNYTMLALSVFLVFCLVFQSYITLPSLVSWLGHWHPVLLHFPIVLLILAIFLGLTGKKVPRLLLAIAALSALLTAVSGFFLGHETTAKGSLLVWHQWLGAGVALTAMGWYSLSELDVKPKTLLKVPLALLLVVIVITAHYGGMLTHGEDFLALPKSVREKQIPENPLVYTDIIEPMLKDKCVGCHNPNKQKGQLLMTSIDMILKGGKNGKTLVPGKPEESEMIKRLHIPLEDENHMPPEGKTQLTDDEKEILERWIALGASDKERLSDLIEPEPLIGLIKSMMMGDPMSKWAAFPKVEDSVIQDLATNYLSLNRIAANSNAISVDMFKPPTYDSSVLVNLQKVANNIVELDLSGIPIGEVEMNLIETCINLEVLEIDNTPVTDKEIKKLVNLKRLRLLKVYGTAIGDESIATFESLPELKSLYLWETNVSRAALADLYKNRPDLQIDFGLGMDDEAPVEVP